MHSLGATWVLPATGTAPEFFDELGSFLMGPKNQKKTHLGSSDELQGRLWKVRGLHLILVLAGATAHGFYVG